MRNQVHEDATHRKYHEGMGRTGLAASPRYFTSASRRFATLALCTILGFTCIKLLNLVMVTKNDAIMKASEWEYLRKRLPVESCLEGCGTNVTSTLNNTATSDSENDAHLTRSPLEVLYEQTDSGMKFRDWVLYHVQRTYPHFPDDDGLLLGTPSVAHDPNTNRTILGFRIGSQSMQLALKSVSYLMLCELKHAPATTGATETVRDATNAAWRCQDSGMENSYIPPECDPRYWKNPTEHVLWGLTIIGPEDARLLLDEEGNLGATMVMRGCHPNTKWGPTTALGSVYTMRWRRTHETWRVAGYPKLLDLRTRRLEHLGDEYPEVTKSWISVPTRSEGTKVASHADPQGLRFSVGWTRDMKHHVVYQVRETSKTLYAVTPLRKGVEYSSLDLDSYRGSTNVVPFKGALLGMGHRHIDSAPTYEHYWYAYCPHPPYYSAVALSEGFFLPQDRNVRTSFALGLAVEGDNLYLFWSEYDKLPRLTLFPSDEVMGALKNSTFARSRGHTYEGVDGFTAMCAAAVAAEAAEGRSAGARNRSSP